MTGSNEMGVSEEEYNSRPAEEWESLKKSAERMLAAGAHFVLDTIVELLLASRRLTTGIKLDNRIE